MTSSRRFSIRPRESYTLAPGARDAMLVGRHHARELLLLKHFRWSGLKKLTWCQGLDRPVVQGTKLSILFPCDWAQTEEALLHLGQ